MSAFTADDELPSLLCLFARAPVLGRVKRRLAPALGPVAALRAHQRLVEDSLGRLADVDGVATELWLDGPFDAALQVWPQARKLRLRAQPEGDLGARMHQALRDSLGRAAKALVVGTDCPTIDATYVLDAVARLDAADIVLAPAEDGGYGLIGARRRALPSLATLFEDMPWGTASVFELTRRRVAAAELTLALTPEVWDVDTPPDWERFLRLTGAS